MKFIFKNFWVILIPLLFMPNDVMPFSQTALGNIQVMDIILLVLSPIWLTSFLRKKENPYLKSIRIPTFIFLLYIFLGVIILPLKFETISNFYFNFSLFKVFKFILYVLFGLFLMDRFKTEKLNLYHKGVLLSIIFISSVLILNFLLGNIGDTNEDLMENQENLFKSYSAVNVVAVALAILLSSQFENFFAPKSNFKKIIFFFGLVALLMSGGRGGGIALLVCLIYYVFTSKSFSSQLSIVFLAVTGLVVIYLYIPEVQYQIDRTVNPNQRFLERNNMGVGGVDDGKRLSGFLRELPKWFNEPFFGYGFFHRGGVSKLATWGSHNFYLQMLLETGLIGVFVLVFIFRKINLYRKKIKETHYKIYKSIGLGLLTAFIGGLSGEYFYGGEALMALLIILVPLGSKSTQTNYSKNNNLN